MTSLGGPCWLCHGVVVSGYCARTSPCPICRTTWLELDATLGAKRVAHGSLRERQRAVEGAQPLDEARAVREQGRPDGETRSHAPEDSAGMTPRWACPPVAQCVHRALCALFTRRGAPVPAAPVLGTEN
jgi:hypothetical protein